MSAQTQALVEDELYPDSDGKPMAETGIHVKAILWLYFVLRQRFGNREDIYVAANMYLYYVEGQPKKRRSPDVMVAKGVKGNHERRSFKTWVEGVVPSCIFEITSKETAKEDFRQKKPLYQRLRVREYFLFDPLDEYLSRQLIGYRLVGKKFKRIKPRADGSLLSKELGVRIYPEGILLGIYDAKTGVKVLNPEEIFELKKEGERKLEEERKKVEELQAELARLKAAKNGARS
jgi:Uma2 family endonuclease